MWIDRRRVLPYPRRHADALNVLAEIEIHEGNRDAAIAAATAANRLAWCDGPSVRLQPWPQNRPRAPAGGGAPEPELPPYDASKHEPIEEIPIEAEDEEPA